MSNIRKRKAADIDTTELRKFIEARRAAAGPSFVETSPTPASASDYESRIIPVSHSHADDPISSERLRQAVEEVRSRRVVTAAHTRTGQSSSASSQQATHREPLLVQNNRSPSQDTESNDVHDDVLDDVGVDTLASVILDRDAEEFRMLTDADMAEYNQTVLNELATARREAAQPTSGHTSNISINSLALALPNKASYNAILSAQLLRVETQELLDLLQKLSDKEPDAYIQSTLAKIESASPNISRELQRITHRDAVDSVKESRTLLQRLSTALGLWRDRYPDNGPIKIDNSLCFRYMTQTLLVPTQIAYTLALSNRIFHRMAIRGSNFNLQLMKIYGQSLIELNGPPNHEQMRALQDIAVDTETVEKRFQLDSKTTPYAVCPECACTYKPSYVNGSKTPSYPMLCLHKSRVGVDEDKTLLPCNTPMLKDGAPAKVYEYQSFLDWFGRFLAHPGIERFGDAFCQAVDSCANPLDERRETWDGLFYKQFAGPDGKPFVADRGAEGRWFFLLHADFFNVEGNRIGGKHESTGVISLTCLNLPYNIRNDPAFVYIAGIVQGPDEPKADRADHSHYLRPLIDDLIIAYTRGIQCYASCASHIDQKEFYNRTHRVAMACGVMDFKCTRPMAGQMDVGSHFVCFTCDLYHKSSLWRTNYRDWKGVDDSILRRGADRWRDAETMKDRKAIEAECGSRHSEFWRLPYYTSSLQILIDSMHTVFLRSQRAFFVDVLQLANATGKDDAQTASKKAKKSTNDTIAHYYAFTPPPSPLRATNQPDAPNMQAEVDAFATLEWGHLDAVVAASRQLLLTRLRNDLMELPGLGQAIGDLHKRLSAARPTSADDEDAFRRGMMAFRWAVLLYVCVDLMQLPDDKFQLFTQREHPTKHMHDFPRNQMVECLLKWRLQEISDVLRFPWPHFTPITVQRPVASWARPPPMMHVDGSGYMLAPEERDQALRTLINKTTPSTALGIGSCHRFLYAPLSDNLATQLHLCPLDSLIFVCYDVNRLPLEEDNKDPWIAQLIAWRKTQPLEALPWTHVDSPGVLTRILKVIQEAVLPSWITNLPDNYGLPKAGTPKADNWRILFMVSLPIALLSLWDSTSPIASDDAAHMLPILETAISLSGASNIMMQKVLTVKDREDYRELWSRHIQGLNRYFPGSLVPSHHLAFHIFDGMENFSTVRNASCFASERLIGKLRRIPINHKSGEFERTLIHSFNKGAAFRRWLLRPDCPPLLTTCRNLMDKAYGFSQSAMEDNDLEDEDLQQPHKISKITAPRGSYTATKSGKPGAGNSYVCFLPPGDKDQDWVPAKIEKIEKRGTICECTVRRWRVHEGGKNSFRQFYPMRVEAKLVDAKLSDLDEIIPDSYIVSHIAFWKMTGDAAIVLRIPN